MQFIFYLLIAELQLLCPFFVLSKMFPSTV